MSQPPAPDLGFLLVVVGRRFREAAESALKQQGLSLRTLSLLGHLQGRPGASVSDLARRAGITPQSVQSTLALLEADGLVVRGADGSRGRRAELTVTPKGRRQVTRGRAAVAAAHEVLLAGVPADQRAHLLELLALLLPGPDGLRPPSP